MRREIAVIRFARGLVDLVAEEAERNPEFAQRLEGLLDPLSDKKPKREQKATPPEQLVLPDIYTEWRARGQTEFRLWLRDQSVAVLRMLIREHDLDPGRRTEKWREAEKLSTYITGQLQARLKTGSGFLPAVRPHHGITLAIRKDGNNFNVCIMHSHVGKSGNELSQLFQGSISFADALRRTSELSEQNGLGSLYEIDDDTLENGNGTFQNFEDWQNTLREIDRQLTPLKERSGLDWSSGQVITSRDLARALPLGPQIERLMVLRASVFKRRPLEL
jgi:hypothetical protein